MTNFERRNGTRDPFNASTNRQERVFGASANPLRVDDAQFRLVDTKFIPFTFKQLLQQSQPKHDIETHKNHGLCTYSARNVNLSVNFAFNFVIGHRRRGCPKVTENGLMNRGGYGHELTKGYNNIEPFRC
jgi:hypothetical protein